MNSRIVWVALMWYGGIGLISSMLLGILAVLIESDKLGGVVAIIGFSAFAALVGGSLAAIDGAPERLPSRAERKMIEQQRLEDKRWHLENDARYDRAKDERRVISLEMENERLRKSMEAAS